MTEGQAQLEMRRFEMKEAEIRLARSRRRLTEAERPGTSPGLEPSEAETRLQALEAKHQQLRSEFEQLRRQFTAMKGFP